jgi:hypothetical protein
VNPKNTTILSLLIALVLACFALSPQARATCQEGCLTNSNTVLGDDALLNNIGINNTAIGFQALFSNETSGQNTATGAFALFSNTTGFSNTAIGFNALFSNTSGVSNTAIGWSALTNNAASWNTAIGVEALEFNTIGYDNTATGVTALTYNKTGHSNTATGRDALLVNRSGSDNTATGAEALGSNRGGNANVANGMWALYGNTTGGKNVAMGYNAFRNNTTGHSNIAVGYQAGLNLTTGDSNIDIGNAGVAAEAQTLRIGTQGTQTNAYIAGISGATVPTGVAVIIDTTGHLGTTTSSARFKDNVQPMDKASEAILALQPVTFRYKKDLDPEGVRQFGLVAEDVEKVNPDLVAHDEQGKPYTVRYEAVNSMLLNEFLKEHRKVQELEATIAQLKSTVSGQQANAAQQQKQIAALAEGLQKVSAELEASRRTEQTVVSNP